MKKYVFSSLLFLLTGLMAMAQTTENKCSGTTCAKCPPECQATRLPDCKEVCTDKEISCAPWKGEVEINGKTYAATARISNSPKGMIATLSIADLKITNEVFTITKTKNNSYSFTPKNNLGFMGTGKIIEVQ